MMLTEFATAQLEAAEESGDVAGNGSLLAVLEQFAAAALEGGVRHSWEAWVGFTPLERMAWSSAGRMLAGQPPLSLSADREGHDESLAEALAMRLASGA